MKKKKPFFSLLLIGLMVSHIPCFAPIADVTPPVPVVAALGAAALPVVAPIVVAQSPIAAMASFAGYVLLKLILNYIAPLGEEPSLVPPRNNREKIINPGEKIHLRSKFVLTNKTDKPIIYDTQSGKIFETIRSQEGDWIKGKER